MKKKVLTSLTAASIASRIPLVREFLEDGSGAVRTAFVHRFGVEIQTYSKSMVTLLFIWLHKKNPKAMKGMYDVNFDRDLAIFATDFCGENSEKTFAAWMFANVDIVKYQLTSHDTLIGRRLFVPLSYHTFAIVNLGICKVNDQLPLMKLTIIGKHAYREVRDLYKSIRPKDNSLGLYNGSQPTVQINGDEWSAYDVLKVQDGSTIIDKELRREIYQYIDNIMALRKVNRKDGTIAYGNLQAGIILYGKRGTGKSSMLKEIAGHYGATIVYVDPFSIRKIDWDDLMDNAALARDRAIVFAYEDIDVVCTGRDDPKNKKKEREAFRDLLQFVDGQFINCYRNIGVTKIHIATTNHLERLEDTLIRPGRFDMKIEMSDFVDSQSVIDLCSKFNIPEESDICQTILKSNVRNPATIQSMILNKVHEFAKGETNAGDKK